MANSNSMVAADGGGEMIANDSDDNDIEEKQSGFAAALGNADVLRQITLVVALSEEKDPASLNPIIKNGSK